MKYKTLMILILLMLSSNQWLKAYTLPDSTSEIKKKASLLLNELAARRINDALLQDKYNLIEDQYQDEVRKVEYQKEIIKKLEQTLDIVKPSWYDNFKIGFLCGVISTIIVYVLIK